MAENGSMTADVLPFHGDDRLFVAIVSGCHIENAAKVAGMSQRAAYKPSQRRGTEHFSSEAFWLCYRACTEPHARQSPKFSPTGKVDDPKYLQVVT
jgi:hypothetical protein